MAMEPKTNEKASSGGGMKVAFVMIGLIVLIMVVDFIRSR